MLPMSQGSFRLFRLAGIDVYLHWSWFLVAYYEINQRVGRYSSSTWACWRSRTNPSGLAL